MTDSTCSSEATRAQDDPCQLDAEQRPFDSGSARWDLASHLRLWPIAAVGLALDLWSKDWAFKCLDPAPNKSRVVIPHLMSFYRSLNSGALFGLGKGWTPLFIAASILALGFVLFLFVNSSRKQRSLHIALALVLAGALGNLYDRAFKLADIVTYTNERGTQTAVVKVIDDTQEKIGLLVGVWPEGQHPVWISANWNPQRRQQGVVRDFIKMEPRITIGSWSFQVWPWVFNLADAWLVIGVGLLLLNFWWERRPHKEAQELPASPAS